MDSKMKHRLIGLIVLVALIVIFLPMLFKKESQEVSMIVQSPQKPSVSEDKLTMPVTESSEGVVSQVPSESEQAAPEISEDEEAALPSEGEETIQPPAPEVTPVIPAAPVTIKPQVIAIPKQPIVATSVASVVARPQVKLPTKPQITTPTITTVTTSVKPPIKVTKVSPKPIYTPIIHAPKIIAPQKMVSVPKISYQKRKQVAQKLDRGWVVQMGSFTEKARAENLVKRLQKSGFKAFSYQTKTARGMVIRVYVGPVVHRDQAEVLLQKVQQKMKLKGFVASYKPTKL
ncbi:MAG: SPOR domain-containing protein [Gammaproteobacteria bacterium]|nr:SPOR domain-containing protein [Gammaproteobacteria bacterium]